MSQVTNTQVSTAAIRVFKTAELLEMILLEVAHAEVQFTDLELDEKSRPRWYTEAPSCKIIGPQDQIPHFIWTPITLRSVSRDFRNTIDGSSKLLRLRLKATPPHVPWDFKEFSIDDNLGPLHWLEWKLGYGGPFRTKVKNGLLELHVEVYGMHEEKRIKRDKLRDNMEGSWRKIPCVEQSNVFSTVVLHLHTTYSEPGFTIRGGPTRIYYRRPLCSCDLGPRPTSGDIFEVIDAAESRYYLSPLIREKGGSD